MEGSPNPFRSASRGPRRHFSLFAATFALFIGAPWGSAQAATSGESGSLSTARVGVTIRKVERLHVSGLAGAWLTPGEFHPTCLQATTGFRARVLASGSGADGFPPRIELRERSVAAPEERTSCGAGRAIGLQLVLPPNPSGPPSPQTSVDRRITVLLAPE